MNLVSYTYKDCSPVQFAADESFREELFTEKLQNAFEMGIELERVHVVFSTGKGHLFQVNIDGVINGKSNDVVLEGYESPSEIVRAAIKQFIQVMRDKKERLKKY